MKFRLSFFTVIHTLYCIPYATQLLYIVVRPCQKNLYFFHSLNSLRSNRRSFKNTSSFGRTKGKIRRFDCRWPDSNRHRFLHHHLKVACIPISPHRRDMSIKKFYSGISLLLTELLAASLSLLGLLIGMSL